MSATTTDTARDFLASLTDADVQRFYDANTRQMSEYVTERNMWTAGLKKTRGNRRHEIVTEIERCKRILWDLENKGNQYGAELNRRGLLD